MVKSTPSVWNEIFGFDLPIMRHLFWKSLAHPLCPVKLNVSNVPDDGSQLLQNVETSFQITRANVHLVEKSRYDVHV
ncbi:unnamed protein product [Lactuca virosa]|uniref:Uncharacterized protein n=1 Tax=Lactuca virosa TaxID=75947 RepID=A0AAU9M8I0_9ASTR|nr:unnamed protein product [Lactuca virosa]